MGERKPSVKRALSEFLAARPRQQITENDWSEIQHRFASSSPGYLRRLLRESGQPLAPLVEGVRQGSFAELERTLSALEREYAGAKSSGNRQRVAACRRLVIEAKTHARFTLRRSSTSAEKKSVKREMVDWMIVWLEDPALFAPWVKLRKRSANVPGLAADK